jgi:hypothetical protein
MIQLLTQNLIRLPNFQEAAGGPFHPIQTLLHL